jgi:hypothetical protein
MVKLPVTFIPKASTKIFKNNTKKR